MDSVARFVDAKALRGAGAAIPSREPTRRGGAIAADALVKAGADGYTLLLAESGTLIVPSLNPKATYEPLRQFCAGSPRLLVAARHRRDTPVPRGQRGGADRRVKANPGQVQLRLARDRHLQHLAWELFSRQAGVNAVHVPYKGASGMMPDLMSGQVADRRRQQHSGRSRWASRARSASSR